MLLIASVKGEKKGKFHDFEDKSEIFKTFNFENIH